MNDEKLNQLLEAKKSIQPKFSKDTDAFISGFFAKIEMEKKRRWRYMPLAATILLCLGLGTAFLLPLAKKPYVSYNKYRPLAEALRLFGNDAAVVFVNNELFTGERDTELPAKNLINLNIRDFETGHRIELLLATSDSDSIAIGDGSIIVSRCDKDTLILDMEMHLDGKTIRRAVLVRRSGGNQYQNDISLS